MSFKTINRGYSATYDVVRDRLDKEGKILYVEMKSLFYPGSSLSSVSIRQLCELTKMGKPKILELLQQFEDLGLIRVRRYEHHLRKANEYIMDDMACALALDPDGSYDKLERTGVEILK